MLCLEQLFTGFVTSGSRLPSSDELFSVFAAGVWRGETCSCSGILDVEGITPGLSVARRFPGGLEPLWLDTKDSRAAARSRSPSGSSSSPSDEIELSLEEAVWDSCAREEAIPGTLSRRALGIAVFILSLLSGPSDASLLAIFGTDGTKTLLICLVPEALGGVCASAANLVERRRPMFACVGVLKTAPASP